MANETSERYEQLQRWAAESGRTVEDVLDDVVRTYIEQVINKT